MRLTVETPQRVAAGAVRRAIATTSDMTASPVVSEAALRERGMEVRIAEVMTLGGGLGSFVFLDLLRNAGMAARDLVAVGPSERPYERIQRLCENSQLGPDDRMRSNSESCPDNPWGFPGYAVREAVDSLRHGNARNAARVMWQVFGEPAMAETYTPRSGQVFRAIEREGRRIGWDGMFQPGWVRAVRKTEEGRLLALTTGFDAKGERWERAVAARVLHVAVGYPAIRLLPELLRFREMYGNEHRVVNAYEEHEAVYEQLRRRGGVVLLRGRGIVASRVIERLAELRTENPGIRMVHLQRAPVLRGHAFGMARRKVENGFEFQPFNWPKSCWTGEHRDILQAADGDERRAYLDAWGGTTTAPRGRWRKQVKRGIREGWYRVEYGLAHSVTVDDEGRIVTAIEGKEPGDPGSELTSDFVIDCTGMEATPSPSSFLADLVGVYGLEAGPVGRLKVNDAFEITGLRHGNTRCYASGAMTLGGPQAAVDSFLGLQYAAMASVADMQGMGLPGLRKLNGLRSVRQWTRWARGAAP